MTFLSLVVFKVLKFFSLIDFIPVSNGDSKCFIILCHSLLLFHHAQQLFELTSLLCTLSYTKCQKINKYISIELAVANLFYF